MDLKSLRRAPESQKASVLIVEDEASVRNLWRGWLIGMGYDVLMAEDGPHAVSLLDKHALHVAVCDVHLPGASGLWVADQIRARSAATAVILATGDPAIPPIESLRPGVVAYLLKPFPLNTLKDAVEAGVRWSAMRRTK